MQYMDQTELSLGPCVSSENTPTQPCLDLDHGICSIGRKRKQVWEEAPLMQSSIELQLNLPLPLDWEQCLDLQSGRMFYMNRMTQKKSWIKPAGDVLQDRPLDLNLNISASLSSGDDDHKLFYLEQQLPKRQEDSGGGMAAAVCVNCHLLVMLSKASPSCPNCKYVHTPSAAASPPLKLETVAVKSLKTLSLLH